MNFGRVTGPKSAPCLSRIFDRVEQAANQANSPTLTASCISRRTMERMVRSFGRAMVRRRARSSLRAWRPGGTGSHPTLLTPVGNTLYFAAGNDSVGLELWRTDGTETGTVVVKDIVPGASSSNPRYLTNVNGTLYFRATNQQLSATELWKSDGTADGTTLVKSNILFRDGSTAGLDGTFYFGGAIVDNDLGITENGLWKSDGTEIGTVPVKEFPDALSLGCVALLDACSSVCKAIISDYGSRMAASRGRNRLNWAAHRYLLWPIRGGGRQGVFQRR